MSRKKLDVRAAAALAAFAVIAVTGGVFYAQSGSETAEASLVLSRPGVTIGQDAQAPDESPSDDSGPAVAPSATASSKAAKKPVKKADAGPSPAATTTKTTTAKKTTAETGSGQPKKQPKTTKKPAASPDDSGSGTTVADPSAGSDRITFGRTYTGIATFYGATGAGNCSYEPTGDLMVAAMNQQDYENSQICGAFVDVTGPAGNTVRVRIVDRCPECAPGHIDLSAQAFAKLAEPVKGRIDISWKLASPSVSGPVKYVYKEGSTQWWCGIQVRNHRNPIRSIELKGPNGWVTLERQTYNYFLSAGGEGCGGPVRITDVQGHQLTDTGIAIKPMTEQAGKNQLPAA